MFDKLVDILLQLPGCKARHNQMKALEIQNPRKSEAIRTELRAVVLSLVSRLGDWWLKYEEETFTEDGKGSLYQQTQPQEHFETDEQNQYSPNTATHLNTSTSAMASLYHSANILAHRLLSLTSPPPHFHEQHIASHSNHILSAAKLQNSDKGQGALLMVFPLKVVCSVAHDEQQRMCAQEMLEQLGQKMGLDGICKRATPVYTQRYRR
jgi:Fungal specific transcription factor domain